MLFFVSDIEIWVSLMRKRNSIRFLSAIQMNLCNSKAFRFDLFFVGFVIAEERFWFFNLIGNFSQILRF